MFASTRVLIPIMALLCNLCSIGLSQETQSLDNRQRWKEVSNSDVEVERSGHVLWMHVQPEAANNQRATLPRMAAPIRSIQWNDGSKSEIKFSPEQEQWIFSWTTNPPGKPVIRVEFGRPPALPSDIKPAQPAADHSILLHAFQATTFGEKLRFEPQWFKNTVGYWTVESDYATWQCEVSEPGTYSVAVLQGCGKGQGGSEATLSLAKNDSSAAQLTFQTIDTGHFQNFRWNHLGNIRIAEAGQHTLKIKPVKIAKNALFDVRAIHLVKQATDPK